MHIATSSKTDVLSALAKTINALQQPAAKAVIAQVIPNATTVTQQKILNDLKAAYYDDVQTTTPVDADWFVSRVPLVGRLQSLMNERLQEENVRVVEGGAPTPFLEKYSDTDPGWIECVVEMWKALQGGKAEFLRPAADQVQFSMPDQCTIVLVADWGGDNDPARNVAGEIAKCNAQYIIHLGDIYYAGEEAEVDNFLALLELANPNGKARCLALNGNHEMYSGGHAYFEALLPALKQPASYFGIANRYWQLLGFDTAYIEHRLLTPEEAVPIDSRMTSQWSFLQGQIAGNPQKTTIFMCHHQPISAYATDHEAGKSLKAEVDTLLQRAGYAYLYGWFFGHEHRCTIYDDTVTGYRARLIGNGCIPHLPPHETGPDVDCAKFTNMNRMCRPGSGDALSGFVRLNFNRTSLDVAYINEDGSTFFSETWTRAVPATNYR